MRNPYRKLLRQLTGMPSEEFAAIVQEALQSLPEEFARFLEDVEVVIEPMPTRAQAREAGLRSPRELLGLYEGVPRTERGLDAPLFPDRITLFQEPIEAICRTRREIRAQVQRTVRHELAHHFGISDRRLRELDAY